MAWVKKLHFTAHSTDRNTFTSGAQDTTGADILIAVLSAGDNSAVLTDSKGNTWTPLTAQSQFSAAFCRITYAKAPTVGTGHTFTCTVTATTSPAIEVLAYSGSHQTAPFDVENGSGYFAASAQPGSVTPNQNSSLIVTGITQQSANSATVAIDSGFTIEDYQDTIVAQCLSSGCADLVQNTAAAINPTWSWTGSDLGGCVMAVFKPAAAASDTQEWMPRSRIDRKQPVQVSY